MAVSVQEGNADSPLEFARHFLHARKSSAALRLGDITFLDAEKPVLAFTREEGDERILCAFNMSGGDAVFAHPAVAKGKVQGLGCGNSSEKGETLTLGPYAAWFAAFASTSAIGSASPTSSAAQIMIRRVMNRGSSPA